MSSPPQLSLLRHQNHFLFSDYYLDNRVRERPEWLAGSEDARAAFDRMAAVWRGYTPNGDNEAQTEHDWIRPVLELLGHSFKVQVPVRTPLGTKKPDYVFYPDADSRLAAKVGVLEEADLRDALAVGDAKAWELPLDRAVKPGPGRAEPEVSANPGFQIDFYIRHTGLPWGILTNGRLWRLYHRDTSKKLDVYYEVDLPGLIEQGDVDAFGFFFHFFRRDAFAGSQPWLDMVLEESRAYEQGVGEHLKAQVYDALRELAQGFLDFPGNGLTPTPENLLAIHDHSLIVLYRLLFTLYAESRVLLPLHENQAYTLSYSLHAMKNRIAEDLRRTLPALESMETIWIQLTGQWRVLAAGHPKLGVPAYNGGLFDGAKFPFLEKYRVGDSHLRTAIDLLARTLDRATGTREFVDYRDLEVRHLGSIYEGLLEYRVRFADEDLAVRKERGREVYAPVTPGEAVAIPAGTVYLATDKGERKVTGSYYTPEYIVQYIVEHTVGPVLEELRERHAGDEAGLVRSVLDLNCLDPAMGSGHFLVATTDFIARFMVAAGLQTVETPGGEAELAYWRRRVVQGCIYGVDLNPLAVELAKLSLWLATVARDKPLSFLDHHLRCGNSLIGARVGEVFANGAPKPKRISAKQVREKEAQFAAGQMSMLDNPAFAGSMVAAVGFMNDIEALRGDTVDEVHEAERLFREVSRGLTSKYRLLMDIWTARFFGMEIEDSTWSGLVRHILNGGFDLPQFAHIREEASRIADERHFFHWELEFPEVFFDKYGRLMEETAGFDAVVGNPPYVRQESLGDAKPFFAEAFPDVFHGTADIFVYFIGQGLRLLGDGRRLSYVASNSWLRANYATPLRHFLREQVTVDEVIDLGDNRVFADAPDVYPAIVVVRRTTPATDNAAEAAVFTRGEGLADFARQVGTKRARVSIHDQSDTGWQLGDDVGRRLLAKLVAGGTPFGEVVEGRIYRGVLTGLNEAFIVDELTRDRLVAEEARSAELIKPLYRGEDLRPWYQEGEGRHIIVIPHGFTLAQLGPQADESSAWKCFLEAHPALATHLAPFSEAARRRQDKGQYWWELRPCDYYDAFDGPKIVWPDIAKLPRFSQLEPKSLVSNTAYMTPTEDWFLLGAVASRLTWLAISQLSQAFGERAGSSRYRLFTQTLSRLPIPDAPTADRSAIGDLAMAITAEARARYALHRRVRGRVAGDLGAAGQRLNQKLTAWWSLDFRAFRAEVQKVFRRDIALKERDEWDEWLAVGRVEHERRTAEIVRLETDLNGRVYGLFGLSAAEVAVVEAATKYKYGEV